jgi:hypothetical protein
MHPFDWFLDRLEVARWNNNAKGSRDIHANCPSCGSSDALHVTEKNGKALVQCFSCAGDYAKVVDALDAVGDMIAPTITRVKRDKSEVKRETFAIRDALGKTITTHTRIDYADDSKDFLWPKGTKPASLPLYGSEDVASFDRSKPVVVTEGERKRNRLKAAGFQSVALAGGSSVEPSDASLSVLRGFSVVLWPDNDAPGRKVMDSVARSLVGMGVVVNVVAWEDAPEKGDAADYLDAHSDAECATLIESAAPWVSSTPSLISSIHDVSDDPPQPLLLDRLEPEDHTILFGDGGTGKGVIAAWWVARLTRDHGMKVCILDYEAHARYEWKPRLRQMGGNLDLVFISQPDNAIWDVAKQLREEMLALDIDYVIVDSVTYACMGQEVEKSATAVKYSHAINNIGFPTLSLAHTTKTDADPKHPFGSVFWSNGARMTIGVVAKEDGRLIQAKKVNARAAFAPQVIDWKWASEMGPSEVPSTLDERPEKVAISPRIAVALASGPMTIAELVVALEADGGGATKDASIKAALERGEEFTSDGKKPATWSLFNPSVKRTSRAKVVAIGRDE